MMMADRTILFNVRSIFFQPFVKIAIGHLLINIIDKIMTGNLINIAIKGR